MLDHVFFRGSWRPTLLRIKDEHQGDKHGNENDLDTTKGVLKLAEVLKV
jgi:hypothetical protein